MTTPTQDELALYAIGHYDGDATELERRIDEEPEVARRLAAEAGFASLVRAAVSEVGVCPRCHDLMDGERCTACEAAVPVVPIARSQRASTWPLVFAAVTLAASVVIVLAMASWDDPPRSATATVPSPSPSPSPIDARLAVPPDPPAPPERFDPPAAPPPKPSSKRVKVTFATRPKGVAVLLDGEYRGLTPLVLHVPRSSTPSRLSLQHIGYHPYARELELTSDRDVVVALVSTGAPPVHEGKFADEQCMQCHKVGADH